METKQKIGNHFHFHFPYCFLCGLFSEVGLLAWAFFLWNFSNVASLPCFALSFGSSEDWSCRNRQVRWQFFASIFMYTLYTVLLITLSALFIRMGKGTPDKRAGGGGSH